ncbi:MAG: DUF433 domain-containing protein [Planctomycetes bacterium]|nr:DUF433 domain-containing protein [Planctomycetota bacterium]
MHARRTDPSEVGIYTIAEVSRFVGANPETVRRWVHGRRFTQRDGSRGSSAPLIETPRNGLLCFYNLVEVYLIHVLRKGLEDELKLPMQRVRRCLENLRRFGRGRRHPLAQQRLIQDQVRLHARRIEWNDAGVPVRYRVRSPWPEGGIGNVTCNPKVAFGRPSIEGVATAVIAERFFAGETVGDLAKDYRLDRARIEEAILCERRDGAA